MAFQVSMSTGELVAWLKTKGLHDYPDDCTKLETKKINGYVFSKMRPEHLEKMGLSFAALVLLETIVAEVKMEILQSVNPATQPVEEIPQIQYCMKSVSAGDETDMTSQSVAGLPTKMWKGREVLLVYFLNPEYLVHSSVNVNKVLDWAKKWSVGDIPKFERTDSPEHADITVEFGDGDSWSMVGSDAECALPEEATMQLSLKGFPQNYQEFLVIHVFGHSLGLEHEHQRSNFLRTISDFIDIRSMKEDPRMKNFDWNFLEHPESSEVVTSPYDGYSVMHFWFDVKWLKDEKHRNLEGVKSDKKLTTKQKQFLKGIHKRKQRLADDSPSPSKADLEFLQKQYAKKQKIRTIPSPSLPMRLLSIQSVTKDKPSQGNSESRVIYRSDFERLSSKEVLELVNDVTKLDDDDITEVLHCLNDVSAHWEIISRNLHVKTGKINELANSGQNASRCLANAITDWIHLNYTYQTFGMPTWRKVAQSVIDVNKKLFLRIALDHKIEGVSIIQDSDQVNQTQTGTLTRHSRRPSSIVEVKMPETPPQADHETLKRIQKTAQSRKSVVVSDMVYVESLYGHFIETKKWKGRTRKLEVVVINGTTKHLQFDEDYFETGHWFSAPPSLFLQPGSGVVGFAANRPGFLTGVTGGMRWKIEGTSKYVVIGFTNPRVYRNKTFIQCTSEQKMTAKMGYKRTYDDRLKFEMVDGFVVSAIVHPGRKGGNLLYEFIVADYSAD